jgi:hypothetical protein
MSRNGRRQCLPPQPGMIWAGMAMPQEQGLRDDGGAVARPGSETPRQIRAWPCYLNES